MFYHRIVNPIPRIIGAIFVYAGIYKLLYPGEATTALASLGMSAWLATTIVIVVLMMELYLGILLLGNVAVKFSLLVSAGLTLIFSVYLFYLSTMAHPPSCGCLGLSGIFSSNRQGAIFGLIRNCLILWALKLAYDSRFEKEILAEKRV